MHRRLTLSIDPQLFARFPSLRVGGFVALHLERVSASVTLNEIEQLLRSAAATRLFRDAERLRPLITPVRVAILSRAVALRHLVPLRGYDVDALPAPAITLRPARPRSDWFVPIGARPTDVPLNDDAVVHAAGTTVLSWAFTARESRQTCLCPATTRAAFVSDAMTGPQARAAAAALKDLRGMLASRGALVGQVVFVDARAPGAELPCEEASVG